MPTFWDLWNRSQSKALCLPVWRAHEGLSGFEMQVGEKGTQLSGGQKRSLFIGEGIRADSLFPNRLNE
jgi:ABC-type multidrug transport system fused ATPase/permease subunit